MRIRARLGFGASVTGTGAAERGVTQGGALESSIGSPRLWTMVQENNQRG
jgi:hypothetical protein